MSSAALSSDESSQSTSGSSPQLSSPGIGIVMHTRASTNASLLLLFLNPLSKHCHSKHCHAHQSSIISKGKKKPSPLRAWRSFFFLEEKS